jgi:Kae1-associated kinase Bud32
MAFCKHIAGQSTIVAIAELDTYQTKHQSERAVQEVMVVIREFQPRLMSYLKQLKNKTYFVFAVDQWVFERDVERGLLGEAIASKLVFPYTSRVGAGYLLEREVELKQRLILESLENLVLNFPELAHLVKIEPQYFLYEVLSNRVRVFPLLAYELSDLTRSLTANEPQALKTYMIALRQLENKQVIETKDNFVTITAKFIAQCQDPKLRIIHLSKNAPRTIFNSLFGVLPQLLSVVTQNTDAFLKTQKINLIRAPDPNSRFIDPQRYVFFPTSEGMVSLSEKIDIKGYTKKLLLSGENVDLQVQPFGGMLNDVYLITAGDRKILVKRFKDWSGFKWFPLTLWSFGARSFAVSGQARLAKECAISEELLGNGFNVPKILHVSNAERIVFMEFIEGKNLSSKIKQYLTGNAGTEVLSTIEKVGETMAKVHQCDIVLGDTKPDNVLIKPDGSIFLIDFEQAQKGGDKTWDIAVFLYYCGHYIQLFDGVEKAEAVAKAFINGYVQSGGKVEDVRKAASSKYTRVFSIFTLPAIMIAISNICKKA